MSQPLSDKSPAWGRLLNTEQLRRYMGEVSEGQLQGWIKEGVIPPPIEKIPSRKKYWDRLAVDESIDQLSGKANHRKGGSIGEKYNDAR